MKTEEKPIYGTIPYFGGSWSVILKPEGSCVRKSLTGYGEFPFDRFCIPVIDFRDDEKVFDWLKLNTQDIRPEEHIHHALKMGLNVI